MTGDQTRSGVTAMDPPGGAGPAEQHFVTRIGWLRAAVLGANDGIVSTASLIVGVASASAARGDILIAGAAGLVAGAMSMAAGEYVSVSSQADTEQADLARERAELAATPEAELRELTNIYVERGLSGELAARVAEELTAGDALAAHVRDELGLSVATAARPIQAALASAATFTAGAALPLILVVIVPLGRLVAAEAMAALLFLALLGALGAVAGSAPVGRAVIRVTFWGAIALLATAFIGRLVGAVV